MDEAFVGGGGGGAAKWAAVLGGDLPRTVEAASMKGVVVVAGEGAWRVVGEGVQRVHADGARGFGGL